MLQRIGKSSVKLQFCNHQFSGVTTAPTTFLWRFSETRLILRFHSSFSRPRPSINKAFQIGRKGIKTICGDDHPLCMHSTNLPTHPVQLGYSKPPTRCNNNRYQQIGRCDKLKVRLAKNPPNVHIKSQSMSSSSFPSSIVDPQQQQQRRQ